MIKAIKATWQTLTATFTVVGRYYPYWLYPLLAYALLLGITFTAVIPLLAGVLGAGAKDLATWVRFALVVFLAYGLVYFVTAFANVMLVLGISGQLDGVPVANTGVLIARTVQRLPLLTCYALVAASLSGLSILLRVLISPLFGGLVAPRVGDRLWGAGIRSRTKFPCSWQSPSSPWSSHQCRIFFNAASSWSKQPGASG